MKIHMVVSVLALGMATQVLSKHILGDNAPWVFISLLFLSSSIGLFKSLKEFRDGC